MSNKRPRHCKKAQIKASYSHSVSCLTFCRQVQDLGLMQVTQAPSALMALTFGLGGPRFSLLIFSHSRTTFCGKVNA